MKLFDLKIVIENLRGSYKKFADTLEEYPILGVTFPVHYGYIDGYIGEDTHDLDVFVGSGGIHGIMKVNRDDVLGGVETKLIIYVTEKEFDEIEKTYKLVINEIRKVSEEEIINLLPTFLDKKKSI
jgi:inorganic pyrophosphatase